MSTRASGTRLYSDSCYIDDLSARMGFTPLVWLLFVGAIDPEDRERSYYWAYVLKKVIRD